MTIANQSDPPKPAGRKRSSNTEELRRELETLANAITETAVQCDRNSYDDIILAVDELYRAIATCRHEGDPEANEDHED